jgi:hypothetical protein
MFKTHKIKTRVINHITKVLKNIKYLIRTLRNAGREANGDSLPLSPTVSCAFVGNSYFGCSIGTGNQGVPPGRQKPGGWEMYVTTSGAFVEWE